MSEAFGMMTGLTAVRSHETPTGRAPNAPVLSIVVPTFCERENLPILVERLATALDGIVYEVIFVDDDSRDGTAQVAKEIAQRDPRVRCIRRVGRRGLSGACVEGILSSAAPIVAVMDADLQHDEALLPRMYAAIGGGADIVIGSRYAGEGTAEGGLSAARAEGSRLSTLYARHILGLSVKDPLSGFFMLRRDIVEAVAPHLSREGFKILLDILSAAPRDLKIEELPFTFRRRHLGESKLDALVALQFATQVLARVTGDVISPRFIQFCLIGGLGVGVHLLALHLLVLLGLPFLPAQIAASFTAMTSNFALNNVITYRDARLTGLGWFTGLLVFYAVCSVGLVANVGVAQLVFGYGQMHLVAGFAGALMSSVFNYATSRALTWRA